MEPSPTLLAEPLVQAQPKLRRRVGRPKDSKGRVIQVARVLVSITFHSCAGAVFFASLNLVFSFIFRRNTSYVQSPCQVRVKRTKVDAFVLVKLFLLLPHAGAIEEKPFKTMT